MVQNLNCSCCFITGNIKVTCAKVFWLQITYRDCTISQTTEGLLRFHSQTENIWAFFAYSPEYSLWWALHCGALCVHKVWQHTLEDKHTLGMPNSVHLQIAATQRCPGCLLKSHHPGVCQLQHTSPELRSCCWLLCCWLTDCQAGLHDANFS